VNVIGVFPPQEIRTGGQKRYAELSRQLVDRGHVLYHVVRRSLCVSLSGTMIPVIPDPPEGDVRPSWWRYGRAVNSGFRVPLFDMVLQGQRPRFSSGLSSGMSLL
jgi:hypothetical protein